MSHSHSNSLTSTTNLISTTPLSLSSAITIEGIEGECNELGMELLNVLEYIGDTINYRKLTLLVQKLSNSMDIILAGVPKLKNIGVADLDTLLQSRKDQLASLQAKLLEYQNI